MKLRSLGALILAVAACSPSVATQVGPEPSPSVSRKLPPAVAGAETFDPDAAFETARALASIGPREATGEPFRRVAALVEGGLRAEGYTPRRQHFDVPAGISWSVRVPKGATFNIVAEPAGFDEAKPYVIVGAHLDTVPQSPGANDNGSGIGVMLELARLAAVDPPRVPVVFIAFGAEEPRGGTDTQHHYGSRHFVARMDARARKGLRGMLSLDRVGIGSSVRVCTGRPNSRYFAQTFLEQTNTLGFDGSWCESRTSDHWSFEKAGLQGARLLGDDDRDYHTPRDLPKNLDGAQLERIGTIAWATLRALR